MIMKKITFLKSFCIFLVLILIMQMFSITSLANDSSEMYSVALTMYSNKTNKKIIYGTFKNNIFFVNANDLCEIIGGKIKEQRDESVTILLNNGSREININASNNSMEETFLNNSFHSALDSYYENGNIYISAIHFLNYIGANYSLSENGKPQLKIVVKYNIFDAVMDYINSDYGNFFSWDEVELKDENLQNKIINAGVVALINRNSNIFKMIFDAGGIQREAIEDALTTIIKCEGTDYFNSENIQLDMLNLTNDVYSTESDIVGFITDVYKSDATEKLAKNIDDLTTVTTNGIGTVINYINAFETAKQFANLTDTERDLLGKTIIAHSDDSETLTTYWQDVYAASNNASERINDKYNNNYQVALDATKQTGFDFLEGAANVKNPIVAAWNGVVLINKLLPFSSNMINKKTQLYNGYLASMIEYIANELYGNTYTKLRFSDFYYDDVQKQIKYLQQLKYDLVLLLKSTLTTREYLISSEFLTEDYEKTMRDMNEETAILLNKVENCTLSGVGEAYLMNYDTDYSWIKEYNKESIKSKMIDFIGMTFNEIEKMFGTNYELNFSESSKSQMTVSYLDENIPFSFTVDINDEAIANEKPNSDSKVSEIQCSQPCNKMAITVDGNISSDVTYSELKNSTKGILWQDAPMIVFTYKANGISIDFQYYNAPKDDSIADFICISKRDWEPTEQDAQELSNDVIYQSVINTYKKKCDENHADNYNSLSNSCFFCSWALCDIDGNGIEELIIQEGTCEQDGTHHIYTIKDNREVELGEYNAWHLSLYDDVKSDGKLVGVDSMSMSGNIYRITVTTDSIKHEVVESFSDTAVWPSYQNPIEFTKIKFSLIDAF